MSATEIRRQPGAAIEAEIAVIGGGPAGLAATVTAAELGARVVNIDESPLPGGQIWRHATRAARPKAAHDWIERLHRSRAVRLAQTSVICVLRDREGVFELLGEGPQGRAVVRATSIILATGARELLLPFPGWTLPGVLGIGGMQALAKSGFDVEGKHIALLGSGPLILPVAALLRRHGAKLVLVAEQAPLSRITPFALSLVRSPAMLIDAASYRLAFAGTSYRTGTWVVAADGGERVTRVTVTNGARQWTVACDLLGVGFGLIPNLEVSSMLGCATARGAVVVDQEQRTSAAGVYAAGETAGVAGVHVAVAEGILAAQSAMGRAALMGAGARTARSRGRRQAEAMHRAFSLRSELRAMATPVCIVCRCEDVALGAIDPRWTSRQAKLYRRVGMGPCQGRICGAAMEYLHGWERDSVRPPLQPSLLSTLVADAITETQASPTGAI